jgi:hypothetical protein
MRLRADQPCRCVAHHLQTNKTPGRWSLVMNYDRIELEGVCQRKTVAARDEIITSA